MSTTFDRIKAAFSRFGKAFRPIAYRGYEMLIMRILMSLVVLRVMPGGTNFREQPDKVGLAHLIDFTFLADPAIFRGIEIVLYAALAVYCSGRLLWLALPYITFCAIAIGTLEGSQGADQHSTQIVALCLLVQCAWHVFAAVRARVTTEGATTREDRLMIDRVGIWLVQQAVAAVYIVSALSKWIAKGDWVRDSYQFPLQVIKSQDMDYYNGLQPASDVEFRLVSELVEPIGGFLNGIVGRLLNPPAHWIDGAISGIVGPMARWMEQIMMSHPGWAPLIVAPGFFLELFAFLLLGGRKLGASVAISLVFFHLTVAEMMNLNFKFNIYLLAILFFSVPFWFESLGRKTLGMIKPKPASSDG